MTIKNFEARNGRFETSAVVKNQVTKQREQRILGDCWQWKTNEQCSDGDNCSFRHDINMRAIMTAESFSEFFYAAGWKKRQRTRSPRGKSPSGRKYRWTCKDYLKGTCTNSLCKKWHPSECLFYKTKSGCRFGEKCSYAHHQVDEKPSKRSVAMLKSMSCRKERSNQLSTVTTCLLNKPTKHHNQKNENHDFERSDPLCSDIP